MLEISQGSAIDAYSVAKNIPEFSDGHYGLDEYKKRLGSDSLILIAHYQGTPAGFKAGYPRGKAGSFYSWMGGVLPNFRRKGIAQKLAINQEVWAKDQGYNSIWFKTRNRNRTMIMFALNNGFDITQVEPKDQVLDHRILMEKTL